MELVASDLSSHITGHVTRILQVNFFTVKFVHQRRS